MKLKLNLNQMRSTKDPTCVNCPWGYVSKTLEDAFKARKKEHMRNVKSDARGSNITKHVWSSNPFIDFKIPK